MPLPADVTTRGPAGVEAAERLQSESAFKRQTLLECGHVVTNLFDARSVNYYATVAKELFQVDDVWWRYEFAKSRGAIHAHALLSSYLHSRRLRAAMWRKELPQESKSWRRLYAVTDQRWQAALLCQMRRTFRRLQIFVRTCVDGTRLALWHVCYRMPSSSTRNGPRIARRRVGGSQSRFRMVPEELMPRTPRMTSRTRGTSRMCTEHKQAKEGATWLEPPRLLLMITDDH